MRDGVQAEETSETAVSGSEMLAAVRFSANKILKMSCDAQSGEVDIEAVLKQAEQAHLSAEQGMDEQMDTKKFELEEDMLHFCSREFQGQKYSKAGATSSMPLLQETKRERKSRIVYQHVANVGRVSMLLENEVQPAVVHKCTCPSDQVPS